MKSRKVFSKSLSPTASLLFKGQDTEHINVKINDLMIPAEAQVVSIGNSMICSDIWHKYHERYFDTIRNFTSRYVSEI